MITNGEIEQLKEFIMKCENVYGNEYTAKFREIAMRSPEHFEKALEIKQEFNNRGERWNYGIETPMQDRPKFVLGCTESWIADPSIKYLRSENRFANDFGTYEGGPYTLYIFDVHGVEHACTDIDENNKPLPIGNAYSYVPRQ